MLKHKYAPGANLEQVGQEMITPVYAERHDYRYVETYKVNSDNLQQLVTAAVARALEDTSERNIVVVNLNIQVAHGGGAKNFWNGTENVGI